LITFFVSDVLQGGKYSGKYKVPDLEQLRTKGGYKFPPHKLTFGKSYVHGVKVHNGVLFSNEED
jgi:hypothetical protein